jgi:hypothetical protein
MRRERIFLLLSVGFCSWSLCVVLFGPPGISRIQNVVIVLTGMIAFVFTSMAVAEWVNRRSNRESEDNEDK